MKKIITIIFILIITSAIAIILIPNNYTITSGEKIQGHKLENKTLKNEIKVIHIKTPKIVRGIYLTKYSFSSKKIFSNIKNLVKNSKINSVVIDISSNNEKNIFLINNDIAKEKLSDLHNLGIYLIARIVAFKEGSDKWYDPSLKSRWDIIKKVSKEAIDFGFDEINYDYVRYPGPTEPKNKTEIKKRSPIINSFLKYLKNNVRDKLKYPISIDIFGSTFVNEEKEIGQNIEEASKYFDYIMPMPYPSHWASGSFGYKNPGLHPYEVVYKSLSDGWNKIKSNPERISKLRPWIQYFNLESIFPIKYIEYTPKMVSEQINACYKINCSGWILWNPKNDYKEDFLNEVNKLIKTDTASSTQNANNL